MATEYTKEELDALMHIMNEAVPPVPDGGDKRAAAHIIAIKAAGTDKGVIFNIETKTGETEPFWFHCWVSKEIAGAISCASQSYGWAKRGLTPRPSDHLLMPARADIATAIEVLSLSTLGNPSGILVRLAVGRPIKHRVFIPVRAALEVALAVTQGGTVAEWWDPDFELIPSRESQH